MRKELSVLEYLKGLQIYVACKEQPHPYRTCSVRPDCDITACLRVTKADNPFTSEKLSFTFTHTHTHTHYGKSKIQKITGLWKKTARMIHTHTHAHTHGQAKVPALCQFLGVCESYSPQCCFTLTPDNTVNIYLLMENNCYVEPGRN